MEGLAASCDCSRSVELHGAAALTARDNLHRSDCTRQN